METILICDDERDIVSALNIYLTREGWQTVCTYSGKEAIQAAMEGNVQLILMDIMMPEMDGIAAMSAIRTFSNVPVILLTAKSEDDDKILGLNVGADDYITKPFSPAEVIARVRSQLRRYLLLGNAANEPDTITIGGLSLNTKTKSVTVDGVPVSLTRIQFSILSMLMHHPNEVFSPRDLYRAVWNADPMIGAENTIAVHIRHLRGKIEINPQEPRYIKVVWGQGYKLEAP